MNQRRFVNIAVIVLIVVLAGIAGYVVLRQQPQNLPINQPTKSISSSPLCEWFMDSVIFEPKTDERVLSGCDDKTFVVLNYEYAKDKNFVYFKPMPNANFMTVIVEGADPKTFELLERCSWLAVDKSHVYQGGRIVEGKDPGKVGRSCSL